MRLLAIERCPRNCLRLRKCRCPYGLAVRSAQHADLRSGCSEVDRQHPPRLTAAAGDHRHPVVRHIRRRVADNVVAWQEFRQVLFATARGDLHQPVEPGFGHRRDDVARTSNRKALLALVPGRRAKFTLAGGQLGDAARRQVTLVEVSPPTLIRNVEERLAICRERALEDRNVLPPRGYRGAGSNGRAPFRVGHVRDLQFAAVPRHVRVIPLSPGQAVAARVPGRLHIEVAALREPRRPVLSFGIHNGDRIGVFVRVNVGHPLAIRRNRWRRGRPEGRRDRPRGAARKRLPVDPLVRLSHEVRGPVRKCEIAAAVAHERAHRDVGREVARGVILDIAHHQHPAVRAPFDPSDRPPIVVPTRLVQP